MVFSLRRWAGGVCGCAPAWAAALALACGTGGDLAAKPDVLLVVVDTLRADRLGAYGFPAAVSPHVDALAARGVVFERAIAAGTETAPSHASIMTSRWVSRHSIGTKNGTTRLDGEETLAARLRAEGFATGAFIGNMMLQRRIGLDAGFDAYDDELPEHEANRPHYFERTAAPTTERALAWLAAQRGDQPVFLWLHYQDPHGPYTPPAPFTAAFPELVQGDEAPLPLLGNNSGAGGIPAYQRVGDERQPSRYARRYAGEVAAFDDALGRLLGAFEGRGRPAVILLTADHGESFGENARWFVHGHSVTPDQARVPLVLVAPGLAPGRRSELVHHVDVLPTVLEWVGAKPLSEADGLALGPLLRKHEPLPERSVFCESPEEQGAYRGDRFVRAGPPAAAERNGTFRWQPGFAPERAEPDAALGRELAAHGESRTPLRYHGALLSPAEVARLRALGYAVPEPNED
jgi:arylsulfatase A-like enzyme